MCLVIEQCSQEGNYFLLMPSSTHLRKLTGYGMCVFMEFGVVN